MNKILVLPISLLVLGTTLLGSNIFAEKMECGSMSWGDKAHDDNSPSESKFKQAAYTLDLCTLAKGIDHEKYSNHVSVDWDKFQNSPAYTDATDEQQDCMKESHEDGNGMNGLGGYEILYCATDDD